MVTLTILFVDNFLLDAPDVHILLQRGVIGRLGEDSLALNEISPSLDPLLLMRLVDGQLERAILVVQIVIDLVDLLLVRDAQIVGQPWALA